MSGRGVRGFLLLGAGLGAAAALAGAAEALTRVIVLDQGRPVRLLAAVHDSREDVLIALGELAFKSEFLLEGSPLRTLGAQMTCDSCHPDGGASPVVFFEGLSDKPGNLDVTNRAISLIEDNVHNPINVPSIVGARHSAPFGRDGRFESVEDFTLFAIANEFAGGIPSDLVIEALVAFQNSLAFPDNPLLGADGRLTDAAPRAARRGEEIFHRPFPGDPARSCASCHRPDNYFLDGKVHDVGVGRGSRAGKAFETPTCSTPSRLPRISMTAGSTALPRPGRISPVISASTSTRASARTSALISRRSAAVRARRRPAGRCIPRPRRRCWMSRSRPTTGC